MNGTEDIFIKAAQMTDIRPTKDQIKDDVKDIEKSFDKIHSMRITIDNGCLGRRSPR